MRIQLTLILSLLLSANLAFADEYDVSITNVTKGQTFTPRLVAIHSEAASFFTLGQPASAALEALAEGGSVGMLSDIYTDTLVDGGPHDSPVHLLGPGMTSNFTIISDDMNYYLSFAAMLLPTNDTFVALSSVKLPVENESSVSYLALAYDAGTEENDQNCKNIPGPLCGGVPFSDESDTDEGYVYISNGFHDIAHNNKGNKILSPLLYDWNGPVALVTITKVD